MSTDKIFFPMRSIQMKYTYFLLPCILLISISYYALVCNINWKNKICVTTHEQLLNNTHVCIIFN